MNANIVFDSICDGVGVRASIFVSGCYHGCPGCHNKDAQDFNYGKHFDAKMQKSVLDYCKDEYVSGITLTGGDPMYNASGLLFFVKKFKTQYPDKDIWIYSGFTYEQIMQDKDMKKLLNHCDVLVDGLYDKTQKDETLSFKGSYNQRIIDLRATLALKSIITWESTYL